MISLRISADLRMARMGGANLAGADFSGSLMNDAQLGRANLEGATLAQAMLWAAVLADANLGAAPRPVSRWLQEPVRTVGQAAT